MKFAQFCIRVLAAIAIFAMGVHFAPVQAAVANDRGSAPVAIDGAHRAGVITLAKQTPAVEPGLAEQHCPPICPTGCPHSSAADCCGSSVLAVASVVIAVILATATLPDEADQSLSGVEPDALQEPPQLVV